MFSAPINDKIDNSGTERRSTVLRHDVAGARVAAVPD